MTQKNPKGMSVHVVKVQVEKESQQTDTIASGVKVQGIQSTPYSTQGLADLYDKSGYHGACIDIKALATAGLGWTIEQAEGVENPSQEQKQKVDEFIKRHAEYSDHTFVETLTRFQVDYEIFGYAGFELARDKMGQGDVAEMYHIPMRDFRLITTFDKGGKLTSVQGGQVVLKEVNRFNPLGTIRDGRNEYVFMRNYNPNSTYYGRPEYIGSLGAIALDRTVVEFNLYRLDNNAIPDFAVLVSGGSLGKDGVKAITEFLRNNFKSVSNAGKTLVLQSDDPESKVELKELGVVKDGSFRGTKQDARDEIISVHHVPPSLLSIATPGKLSTTTQGGTEMDSFNQLTVGPRRTRLEYTMNRIFRVGLKVTDWQFKLNRFELSKFLELAQYLEILVGIQAIDSDEAREEAGWGPRAGGKINPTGSAVKLVKELTELRKALKEAANAN